MTGSAKHDSFGRRIVYFLVIVTSLVTIGFGLPPAQSEQKTTQEPVRTTMPAGPSKYASKMMMAPIMSTDERNAVYFQWGLIIVGVFTAVASLVIWIFLNTRKEGSEPDKEEDKAYAVPSPGADSKPAEAASVGSVAPSSSGEASAAESAKTEE